MQINWYLKITLFIFLFFVLAAQNNLVSATSGACSGHGGVNCSAGADWDGSVICYDGWRSSSVLYTNMSMCGYSSPTYYYSNSSYSSCPTNSYANTTGSCTCFYGYIVDTDISGNQSCISGDTYCKNLYGYNTKYNSLDKTCECQYGYAFSNNKCINTDQICQDIFGLMSSYNSISQECECDFGYEYNGTRCVKQTYDYPTFSYDENNITNCPENSSASTDGGCYCNTGYKVNETKDACTIISCQLNATLIESTCYCNEGFILDNNICITHTENCIKSFGENVIGIKGDNEESSCYCNYGFAWNAERTNCVSQGNLYQRPTNTVVIPTVINSYIGKSGKTVYIDRPIPTLITGAMIKGETDPATYIIDIDGKLRWIKTEDVAKRLFGTNWDSYITWFSDSIIYTYNMGESIEQ